MTSSYHPLGSVWDEVWEQGALAVVVAEGEEDPEIFDPEP
jgi:hypothetical protein